jgi:predicted dehydrogenase
MLGLIGSGFAFYGYLPALVHAGNELIAINSRSKVKFTARKDIHTYSANVFWVEDQEELLSSCNSLVIAIKPAEQYELAKLVLSKYKNISSIYFEKPLAESHVNSRKLLAELLDSSISFRIGYIFRYTNWGKSLLKYTQNESIAEINLTWEFMAHHNKHMLINWKSSPSEGGGVLRFYGIHIIALLSEIGYKKIKVLESTTSNWNVIFSGEKLPRFNVEIDTNSKKRKFQIFEQNGLDCEVFCNQDSPFEVTKDGLDERVPLLVEHINSIHKNDDYFYRIYMATIDLWEQAENSIYVVS